MKWFRKKKYKNPETLYVRCLLRQIDSPRITQISWIPSKNAYQRNIVKIDGVEWYISVTCRDKLPEEEIRKKLDRKD
jgi:uncharacterized cysteine cluster protein YcgN (CxxCxxCC family)